MVLNSTRARLAEGLAEETDDALRIDWHAYFAADFVSSHSSAFKPAIHVGHLLFVMVLQSMLNKVLQRLEGESLSEHQHSRQTVKRIAVAGAVLTAPLSRRRLQNIRHHCCEWSIQVRIIGSGSVRCLKDLCDDLK